MSRFKFLPFLAAMLTGVVMVGASQQARADFIIRATDLDSTNAVVADVTTTGLSAANGSGSLVFANAVGNFTITLVTNIATTGTGFTAASQTVNITYTGPTGASSDTLIIEVLGNDFSNPTSPPNASITSNASPSTDGLEVSSVTMTSGVLSGTVTALGAAGTTLGGQFGETTGTGTMGAASSVLMPNPVTGASFPIPSSPFSFYQTYTFSGFNSTNEAGSLSAGSTVSSPAPAALVLAAAGLPMLGGYGWLRRRKAVKTA